MGDDIERLAMEELLRETKRAKERADVMGAMGWKRGIASANKTFLANTLVSTLRDYRHLDRDRKQRPLRNPSPEDNKNGQQRSSTGRNESRRRLSPEPDKKSEARGQDSRSGRNRRTESPDRKHKKRNPVSSDRRNRVKGTSPEWERKDPFNKSSLEEERHDIKRTGSQKLDRSDIRRKESTETHVKSGRIRSASIDVDCSDSKKRSTSGDCEMYDNDPSSIPLPEYKPTDQVVTPKQDKQDDLLTQSVSREESENIDLKQTQEEENIKDFKIVNLPENNSESLEKSDADLKGRNSIEKEKRNLEVETLTEDQYSKEYRTTVQENTNITGHEGVLKENKLIMSVSEMGGNEVSYNRQPAQESDYLDEKTNKKKRRTHHNSKNYSSEKNYHLKSSEKYRKGDKHRKQKKEAKRSKHAKYHNDKLDKHEAEIDKVKGTSKVKEKTEMEENTIESGDALKDKTKSSDFENETLKAEKDDKAEDCIERNDTKILHNEDKVDKDDEKTAKYMEKKHADVTTIEQRPTEVNDSKDIEYKSKRIRTGKEKQEKRKRKRERSGHHHKHKKHKKDHK